MKRTLFYWLPVLVWMGVIFLGSTRSEVPKMPEPLLQTIVAKSVHLSEYAILAMLLWRAFGCAGITVLGKRSLLPLVVAIIYGLSDEFHQSFTPLRTPSPVDVAIDTFGAGMGLTCLWLLRKTGTKFLVNLIGDVQTSNTDSLK